MAEKFDQTCMSLLVSSCECPLCHRVLKPPIKMCLSGHCFCVGCVLNSSTCPTCQRILSCSKLAIFEQVLNIVNFMCVHAKNGCVMLLDNAHKAEHGALCEWRRVNCLWCEWSGCLNKWEGHIKDQHGPYALVYETEGFKDIPLGRDVDKTLFCVNGVMFCLFAVQDRDGPLFLTFQCYPLAKENMKTLFSINLVNNGLHFSQSIHPISDSVKRRHVFKDLDKCVIIPRYLTKDKKSFDFVLIMGAD